MKAKTKPLLRGWSHQISAFLALLTGAYLVSRAQALHPEAATGTTIYAASLFFLFSASAIYHRPQWDPKVRAVLRRVDHSAIYLLIAGTSTAMGTLTLHDRPLFLHLLTTWVGAGLGICMSLFWIHAPKPLAALIYVLISLALTPFLPQIAASLKSQETFLILLGAAIYIAGAVVYGLKRPDPFPRIFGYHEIFHALVVVAAVLHYWVILRLIR